MITAREHITYNAIKKAGIENVKFCPDTAFVLDAVPVILPEVFEKKVVGINISPMVFNYEKSQGMVFRNYHELIRYILYSTDFNIVLIPHVIWDFNDDLQPLKELYEVFKESKRVVLIDSEKEMNACQLKYIISKCSYMVASRTHASIAAYSSGVPTIVVGYSVKARGIALDIFGDDTEFVCPVQTMPDEHSLKNSFINLVRNAEHVIDKEMNYIYNAKNMIFETMNYVNKA